MNVNDIIKIKIDGQKIEVRLDTTILDAARQAGIDIPTMCYLKEVKPSTTCMVCVVKIKGNEFLAPSCGTLAEDGMDIETNTPEVQEARKKAVELLLSEHTGDCSAPCQRVCPSYIDIPAMIRGIQKADFNHARDIIAESAQPSEELCARCKKPCEAVCRRHFIDEPVSIALLMKSAIDHSSGPASKPVKAKKSGDAPSSVSRLQKPTEEELNVFLAQASDKKHVKLKNSSEGYTEAEAKSESLRCLYCDCRKKDVCVLQRNAVAFDSKQAEYQGERIPFTRRVFDEYIYEPGKCIKCGICVRISEKNDVPAGFTFFSRGFSTNVSVPFNRYESEELKKIIQACIMNCPTGALANNKD